MIKRPKAIETRGHATSVPPRLWKAIELQIASATLCTIAGQPHGEQNVDEKIHDHFAPLSLVFCRRSLLSVRFPEQEE